MIFYITFMPEGRYFLLTLPYKKFTCHLLFYPIKIVRSVTKKWTYFLDINKNRLLSPKYVVSRMRLKIFLLAAFCYAHLSASAFAFLVRTTRGIVNWPPMYSSSNNCQMYSTLFPYSYQTY